MSRLDYVTIAIVAVCVAALIYLIYMTTNLLGGSDEPAPTEEETTSDFGGDSTYSDTTYYFDSADTTAGGEAYDADAGEYDRSSGNVAEENLDKGAASARTQPAEQGGRAEVEEYAPPREAGTGNYLVLAGTFSVKANAEEMVGKLRGMGYPDASAEPFDRGKYSVVLVARFNALSEANNLAAELKGKGVEAYVKKKQ